MWADLHCEVSEMFGRLEVPTYEGFRTFDSNGYESPEDRRQRQRKLEATAARKAYKAAWRLANRDKENARHARNRKKKVSA